jgi:integrase
VYYDRTKKLWVGAIDYGAVGGQRRRKVVKAKAKADMLAKLNLAQTRQRAGLPAADDSVTVGEWLDWWLDHLLPRTAQPKTIDTYRSVVNQWIKPHVGAIRLVKLQPEHVEAMMAALERQGLAANSVSSARRTLRRALALAEKRGKVTRNVAALAEPPPRGEPLLDDLTVEETTKVLQAAEGDRLEALAKLVLAVGLRKGEALRLRWDDLDLRRGTLTVTKSKTKAGQRTISLPPFVTASLKAHRASQAKEKMASRVWADPGLVFTTTIGTPIPPNNASSWWHALTERAGIGRRRFYCTRHTAATLMLNNGVPLEVVSATLGHASLAVTADIYAKVRPDLQRTAAEVMDRVLGGR